MLKHSFFKKENSTKVRDKTLQQRATGRFYTHEVISEHLVKSILDWQQAKSEIKVVEPFCGDGRLICNLLELASKKVNFKNKSWYIEIWDCHDDAVKNAKYNILKTASSLKTDVKVRGIVEDTFTIAPQRFGEFDICITNPPWELLKPDPREMKGLNEEESVDYINHLRHRDNLLSNIYPLSRPLRRFSGWGINLSRCGTELALQLISQDGICGLVSPASLLADQMSETLRQWIFQNFSVYDIAYFVAEAKLFEKVDQSSITLVASSKKSEKRPVLAFYNRHLEKKSFLLSDEEWQSVQERKYILPLHFDLSLIKLQNKWNHLPKVKDLENKDGHSLWVGREIDETRHKRFLSDKGKYLFVKGRMIKRFKIVEVPSQYLTQDAPRVPVSATFYRLAWRDVSRPSQKRRIYATIIPPNWVAGNSLHVAYFRDGNLQRLKALLAIFNSLVFESQIRANLATGHISLGVVRQAHIPDLTNSEIEKKLSSLVDLCSKEESLLADLEVTVARLYGLSKSDFEVLLSSFQKLKNDEVKKLLLSKVWLES